MAQCEVCGNDYDKSFEVVTRDGSHVFDSFECTIHLPAPSCMHCGCGSLAMASKLTKQFTAALTVPRLPTS
jgi:uncharacterized Zn finger protein